MFSSCVYSALFPVSSCDFVNLCCVCFVPDGAYCCFLFSPDNLDWMSSEFPRLFSRPASVFLSMFSIVYLFVNFYC